MGLYMKISSELSEHTHEDLYALLHYASEQFMSLFNLGNKVPQNAGFHASKVLYQGISNG